MHPSKGAGIGRWLACSVMLQILADKRSVFYKFSAQKTEKKRVQMHPGKRKFSVFLIDIQKITIHLSNIQISSLNYYQ